MYKLDYEIFTNFIKQSFKEDENLKYISYLRNF